MLQNIQAKQAENRQEQNIGKTEHGKNQPSGRAKAAIAGAGAERKEEGLQPGKRRKDTRLGKEIRECGNQKRKKRDKKAAHDRHRRQSRTAHQQKIGLAGSKAGCGSQCKACRPAGGKEKPRREVCRQPGKAESKMFQIQRSLLYKSRVKPARLKTEPSEWTAEEKTYRNYSYYTPLFADFKHYLLDFYIFVNYDDFYVNTFM
ncbi:MAG: hypothetical protein LUH51_03545 [Firmicutes bacterium]|nr:hypothetical protein [Bacillota bacterium]